MTNTEPKTDTISVTVDGKEIDAKPGELVIEACERAGIYIPRFCYHPRMRPVGMCRMCIVEIDTGRGPALQPSCMIPVAPDMKVDTRSEVTVKAQDGVLEFLLINHPLDCPVCDKGGECPLQDQTLSHGPGESRMIEEKRHFEKPIPISDLVNLDRERCILCDRCTRFAKEVAGDPLIHFLDRGNQTQVNTFPDHPFASYFSGNTVQICPVGALTATPYRFRARPWDLEQTESTCTSCSVGCRVVIDSSRNEVLRYNGVDIDPVNWSWMCDKGRFDFESIHHPDRLGVPLVRARANEAAGELQEARWSEALGAAAVSIIDGLERTGPSGLAVIGGARLTNEAAYAWTKLAKGVVGTDNVDAQLGDGLPATTVLGLPRATIDQVCAPGGTVLLLGPDLKEELPVLHLRLRHAVIEDGVKLVQLSPAPSALDELAVAAVRYRPGEAVEALDALLGDGRAPAGSDPHHVARAIEVLRGGQFTVILGRPSLADTAADVSAAASAILRSRPDARFLSALRRANVHGALDMGMAPGVLPGRVGLDAGRDWFATAWDTVPGEAGLDCTGILQAAADGRIDTLVLLGADPLTDFPDHDLAVRALSGARSIIACDTFLSASAAQADVVLPAAGYAEVGGTTTNIEGRISVLGPKVTPPGSARADWMIAAELARRLGADLRLESAEEIWEEIEELAPSHSGITLALLGSIDGADGVVAPLPSPLGATATGPFGEAVGGTDVSLTPGPSDDDAEAARGEAAAAATRAEASKGESGGDSGEHDEHVSESTEQSSAAAQADDTAPDGGADQGDDAPTARATPSSPAGGKPSPMTFEPTEAPTPERPAVDAYSLRLVTVRKLYDRGTLVQHSRSLAGLAGTTALRVNPSDFDRLGVTAGSPVRAETARGSHTVEVLPDPAVLRGTAVVGFNLGGVAASDLIDATTPVNDLRLEVS
jgi:NADH-quinone oxidoreductase subunit G